MTCPIRGGELALRHRGTATELAADSLSPTNHRTGEHGDLHECRECGTVHQPSPRAAAPGGGLVRGHAGPVVADGACGRRPLVGAPARAHAPDPEADAARADPRGGAVRLRGRGVRALVLGRLLDRGAGPAWRAPVRGTRRLPARAS